MTAIHSAAGRSSRVLIVEDNEQNGKLATAILRRYGYLPTVAVTGEIGLELAAQQAFDVILMDMQLPGMDGIEATVRLRRIAPEVPVIAVTALALPEDRERARAAGCVGYVVKPYGLRQLLEAIEAVLSAPVNDV